jgi:hypothetical protein
MQHCTTATRQMQFYINTNCDQYAYDHSTWPAVMSVSTGQQLHDPASRSGAHAAAVGQHGNPGRSYELLWWAYCPNSVITCVFQQQRLPSNPLCHLSLPVPGVSCDVLPWTSDVSWQSLLYASDNVTAKYSAIFMYPELDTPGPMTAAQARDLQGGQHGWKWSEMVAPSNPAMCVSHWSLHTSTQPLQQIDTSMSVVVGKPTLVTDMVPSALCLHPWYQAPMQAFY